MSDQALPSDIEAAANAVCDEIEANGYAALPVMFNAIAQALLAERQKHDLPTSPDLQAVAERVFYKVDKTPWKDDAIEIIAKALQAAEQRGKEAELRRCVAVAEARTQKCITEIVEGDGYWQGAASSAAILGNMLSRDLEAMQPPEQEQARFPSQGALGAGPSVLSLGGGPAHQFNDTGPHVSSDQDIPA